MEYDSIMNLLEAHGASTTAANPRKMEGDNIISNVKMEAPRN